MKDRVFTAPDVPQALDAAAAALGLPRGELRYVVLDAGGAGSRGLKGTPARVAVMLEAAGPSAQREDQPPTAASPVVAPADVRGTIRAVVRSIAETGGLDVTCEVEDVDDGLIVELRGAGCSALYGEEGAGEPLRAIEHLLQRMLGEALRPQSLHVRCRGFRERRDQALGETARRLAAECRSDGQPRLLDPMNAYERRIVHLALEQEPGVFTQSTGEGMGRRVQILPAAAAEPPAADGRDGE